MELFNGDGIKKTIVIPLPDGEKNIYVHSARRQTDGIGQTLSRFVYILRVLTRHNG